MASTDWRTFDGSLLEGLYTAGWINDNDVSTEIQNSKSAFVLSQLDTQATLRLVDALGGTEVYPSRRPKDQSQLVGVIGKDKTKLLATSSEGICIYVPRLNRLRTLAKRRCVAMMRSNDISPNQIAVHLRMTVRAIYNIIADDEFPILLMNMKQPVWT